jgi:hypothetical protein
MKTNTLTFLSLLTACSAFSGPTAISLRRSTRLHAFVPPGPEAMDFLHTAVSSTSTLLSDAAAAVPDEPTGWWANYLNVYKNSLLFVHSTIDQPLRNAGFDQTWGPSIFLFTAGM